jgi:hypothetical protein
LGTDRRSFLAGAISINDILFLGAGFISFLLSVYLWFTGSSEQAIFVGIWVPSIITLGIYFRLIERSRYE